MKNKRKKVNSPNVTHHLTTQKDTMQFPTLDRQASINTNLT